MKKHPAPHSRALGALVPTLMVLAAPAAAQEMQTATTPPPAATVGSQAAPAAAPAPAQPAMVQIGPSAPVVQQNIPQQRSADEAAADAAPARTTQRAARAVPTRPVVAARTATPKAAPAPATTAPESATQAPVKSTPATQPAPAPVAQNPATPDTQPPATADTPSQPATTATATDSTQQSTGSILANSWPWLVAGIVAILAIGLLALRRGRRNEDVVVEQPGYAEPGYVEPLATAPIAPVAVEPAPIIAGETYVEPAHTERTSSSVAEAVAIAREPQFLKPEPAATTFSEDEAPVATADQAELVEPEAAAVEALTSGDAPVADRPWLEMAMRPIRAGTSADDAVVEIELTIGNAGSVPANGVRISTFMFAGEPDQDEMERLLLGHDAAAVPPVWIDAGAGTTLEATLSLPRDLLDGEVSPVIVADARYSLPGGGEGHTSAAFRIGVREEDGSIRPIRIGKPHMTETVDAELYGTPERV